MLGPTRAQHVGGESPAGKGPILLSTPGQVSLAPGAASSTSELLQDPSAVWWKAGPPCCCWKAGRAG